MRHISTLYVVMVLAQYHNVLCWPTNYINSKRFVYDISTGVSKINRNSTFMCASLIQWIQHVCEHPVHRFIWHRYVYILFVVGFHFRRFSCIYFWRIIQQKLEPNGHARNKANQKEVDDSKLMQEWWYKNHTVSICFSYSIPKKKQKHTRIQLRAANTRISRKRKPKNKISHNFNSGKILRSANSVRQIKYYVHYYEPLVRYYCYCCILLLHIERRWTRDKFQPHLSQ